MSDAPARAISQPSRLQHIDMRFYSGSFPSFGRQPWSSRRRCAAEIVERGGVDVHSLFQVWRFIIVISLTVRPATEREREREGPPARFIRSHVYVACIQS